MVKRIIKFHPQEKKGKRSFELVVQKEKRLIEISHFVTVP